MCQFPMCYKCKTFDEDVMAEDDRKADLEFLKSREKFLNKNMVSIIKEMSKIKVSYEEEKIYKGVKKYYELLNKKHRFGYNRPTK